MVEKDPERAIPLFWSAINAGDRVDSALKDMVICFGLPCIESNEGAEPVLEFERLEARKKNVATF